MNRTEAECQARDISVGELYSLRIGISRTEDPGCAKELEVDQVSTGLHRLGSTRIAALSPSQSRM